MTVHTKQFIEAFLPDARLRGVRALASFSYQEKNVLIDKLLAIDDRSKLMAALSDDELLLARKIAAHVLIEDLQLGGFFKDEGTGDGD